MIYQIVDIIQNKLNYVVSNKDSYNQVIDLPNTNEVIIGDKETAEYLLNNIRNTFLEKNIEQFTCYKEFPIGSNINFAANLDEELANTEATYFVFNPITGSHVLCDNLDEAKETQLKIKQDFCDFQGITYRVFENLAELKKEFMQIIPVRASVTKTFQYNGTTLNLYHTKKGEGLPAHEHTFNHATVCVQGSCLVKTQNQEIVLTKNSDLIDLGAHKWHEITALENDTIFINIFPSNLAQDHDSY